MTSSHLVPPRPTRWGNDTSSSSSLVPSYRDEDGDEVEPAPGTNYTPGRPGTRSSAYLSTPAYRRGVARAVAALAVTAEPEPAPEDACRFGRGLMCLAGARCPNPRHRRTLVQQRPEKGGVTASDRTRRLRPHRPVERAPAELHSGR